MGAGQAKKEYNKLLKRFYNAEHYFDRKDVSSKDKEKYIGEFEKILKALNYLLDLINDYERKNILGGFNV